MVTIQKQAVNWIDTPYGEEPVCPHCGSTVIWVDCDHCDEGMAYHDCGEDTCCCLNPLPNVPCDICEGQGGWWLCSSEACEKSLSSENSGGKP